jgi:hypothetical protein
VMLTYRAAAFWSRLHAGDILMGMQATDELADAIDVTPGSPANPLEQAASLERLNEQAKAAASEKPARRKRGQAAADAPPPADAAQTPPAAPGGPLQAKLADGTVVFEVDGALAVDQVVHHNDVPYIVTAVAPEGVTVKKKDLF